MKQSTEPRPESERHWNCFQAFDKYVSVCKVLAHWAHFGVSNSVVHRSLHSHWHWNWHTQTQKLQVSYNGARINSHLEMWADDWYEIMLLKASRPSSSSLFTFNSGWSSGMSSTQTSPDVIDVWISAVFSLTKKKTEMNQCLISNWSVVKNTNTI